MCLWKAKAGDEGIRSACDYLKLTSTQVTIVDFLSNEISPLGCAFIGEMLPSTQISILKLDHNPFGSKGLENLAKGLAKNGTLVSLSLAYCEIDAEGGKYLQQILAFIKSELKSLDLSGNNLQNDGALQVFKALEVNAALDLLNLADNKFGEDPKLITQICTVFDKNKTLGHLELTNNGITDDAAKQFLEHLKGNKSVYKLELNHTVNREIVTEINALLKKNAPKGKKKKKKKA